MKHIIEIQISTQRVSKKRQWEILVGLYKEILHKDPNWHFFYEIFYNIVRCSKKFQNDVEAYLKRESKTVDPTDKSVITHFYYEVKGPWVDNQEITKKYQKHFRAIFHANSEMIMSMALAEDPSKIWREIYLIADRLTHCFILNCDYIADDWKKVAKRSTSWESYLTFQIASDRGQYAGQCAKRYSDNGVSMEGYENDYSWAYDQASSNGGKVK
jgi:ribosomal protein S17E